VAAYYTRPFAASRRSEFDGPAIERKQMSAFTTLLSQTQFPDDLLISRAILPGEIFQKLISPADQFQQTPAGGMVFFMNIEMLAELIDARGNQRDLHFRRAGVFIVNLVLVNNLLFLL
jgi:hypothetical protein